ncbi:allophanate hydrolase subunit 1 [Roseomonas soli]|uniref:Allophanate hydrolase subunit 1 n=1 Tax=Neoroseomonas soli TaxID=1081025 RepID=A0A9X9WR17_9PROT|nr:allophanate hydrolase subunit 1 [Neoroseomonas soli]MBR0669596.1 allophanate hydrolase subunit 1 [Neoroseomonas soli]
MRAAGDQGLLVEFGDSVDVAVSERVLAFDAALRARPFHGFTESTPSYAAVLVGYDPLEVTPSAVRAHVEALLAEPHPPLAAAALHELPVCYEQPFAPDLADVAQRCGMSEEAVIAAHLSGEYRVFMFGFAPGYGYLGGVPEAIRVPRKPNPVRARPPGSLAIAGPMCLVTTVTAPTGWWVIGRSPARIVDVDRERQFLFEVGDRIRFRRIRRDEFDAFGSVP